MNAIGRCLLIGWALAVLGFFGYSQWVGGMALPGDVQQGHYFLVRPGGANSGGFTYTEVDKDTFDRSRIFGIAVIGGIPFVAFYLWKERRKSSPE